MPKGLVVFIDSPAGVDSKHASNRWVFDMQTPLLGVLADRKTVCKKFQEISGTAGDDLFGSELDDRIYKIDKTTPKEQQQVLQAFEDVMSHLTVLVTPDSGAVLSYTYLQHYSFNVTELRGLSTQERAELLQSYYDLHKRVLKDYHVVRVIIKDDRDRWQMYPEEIRGQRTFQELSTFGLFQSTHYVDNNENAFKILIKRITDNYTKLA